MTQIPIGQIEYDSKAVILGWNQRPVSRNHLGDANAMTIDVEDYFQVEAFANLVDRINWDNYECRVERNVDRILEMLRKTKSHATFFVLGWIAERFPKLIERIVAEGHELASHGYAHQRSDRISRKLFLEDISRAKTILEDIAGTAVMGYRAPSFSVSKSNLWFMETVEAAGYRYSSSTHPIPNDNYGIPEGPRFAFYPLAGSDFVEIPVTCARFAGMNWPCGGGGYFRLLPYALSQFALRSVSRAENQPCVFYFHPWEIDPQQPRIPDASAKSRIRHYVNLAKMEGRLMRLFSAMPWRRIDEIYPVNDPFVRN
jgi:polysaccharide deacetylase family protein (PEP-CTERM system associated)